MRTAPILTAVMFCALTSFAVSPFFGAAPHPAAAASAGPLSVPSKIKFPKEVFGTVGATSAPKNVTLANKGTDPISLLGVAVQGDFAVDPAASTCGASLAPGEKCVLAVTFTPTALGDRVGLLTITHGAAGSPQTVALKGQGVLGKLTFGPSLKFPDRTVGGSGPAKSVLVHNPNVVPLPITLIDVSGADFVVASRTCGSALAAGADCTIAVGFAPAAAGARKGKLWIGARAARSPKAIGLKGKGVAETCGGTTADLSSDAANCGGCGNACPATCVQGQCQGATVNCGLNTPDLCVCGSATTCTDFFSDPANCGGCGNVCFVGQTCQHGTCRGCTSASAPDECGTLCTSFQGDPFNCGGCGAACPSGLCLQGKCLSCTESTPHECGGQCTNVLTDAANCGGCGNACPAGVTCQDGQCAGIVCSARTPDQCGSGCTNLKTDLNNCGACGTVCAGESCVQGQCVTCGGGAPDQCGSACTDFTTDSANCGGCGNVCPDGSTCSGGTCVGLACSQIGTPQSARAAADAESLPGSPAADCRGGKIKCGTECVKLGTPLNCLFCGDVCTSGVCLPGGAGCLQCDKPETPNVCGTRCVDFYTDPGNCGGCGKAFRCVKPDLCLNGVCQRGANCGGILTNTNISKEHCGACNHPCTQGPCVLGKCRIVECVDEGDINCNGVCVFPFRDSTCGGCIGSGGVDCAKDGLSCVTSHGKTGCSRCTYATPDDCGLGKPCTNLMSDPKNCRECGTDCGDLPCLGNDGCKTCSDPLPDICDGECVNLRDTSLACGNCQKFCENGYCFERTCIPCPSSAPTQCGEGGNTVARGNNCKDTKRDQDNCGACDHPCDPDQKCVDGLCKGGFHPCDDPTKPNACGPNVCVNFEDDATNCGGCGNVCPSGSCVQRQCTPGFCGTFEVTAWDGAIVEGTTDTCNGSTSLSLDQSLHSTLRLTPSLTVPGGCDVSGALQLVQGGGICGVWGGLWRCGGTVNVFGTMVLGCSCNVTMGVSGTFQVDYVGSWGFHGPGKDADGNQYTDTGSGSFTLKRSP